MLEVLGEDRSNNSNDATKDVSSLCLSTVFPQYGWSLGLYSVVTWVITMFPFRGDKIPAEV